MPPASKEVSQSASFPEVCNVCVCQVKTATCFEISEHPWRPQTVANTTSRIFFQKQNKAFFFYKSFKT